jgi:glutamyl-Q tRNA(Asp) synthetase
MPRMRDALESIRPGDLDAGQNSPVPERSGYVGRFAPSPTGPLHAGSLATALASRLDALAHGGRWLLRVEDLDPPREVPGAAAGIVATLARLGFASDGPIVYQSRRGECYQAAFDRLHAAGLVYPCACTRREIADSLNRAGLARERNRELVYPGTCRDGMPAGRSARAWRLRVGDALVAWTDRSGRVFEDRMADEVGDFVLRRADGLWAYQLAVVVDDAAQGVTDIVRGEDLLGSTSRQILLQRLLGLPTPRYLHLPVVAGADGEKLSKQNGAEPVDASRPLEALRAAMRHLDLPTDEPSAAEARARPDDGARLENLWKAATRAWRASRYAA